VVGIATQQFVAQSAFVLQSGSQPSWFVASNVVHVNPLQHCRTPPHGSSFPEHWQSVASAQNPLSGMLPNGMQHPLVQSEGRVQGIRHPA
jgi:hypothetical protein